MSYFRAKIFIEIYQEQKKFYDQIDNFYANQPDRNFQSSLTRF